MRDPYLKADNFRACAAVPSVPVIQASVPAPDFTVFIPTYRRAETLKVTLDSVLNQREAGEYEILIINNDPAGGEGETLDLIAEADDPRISYYVNQENIGLCGNWNRGIELARGEYVVMIHDDDLLSPWFMKAMRQAVRENGKPEVLGVSWQNFDSSRMPGFTEPVRLAYRPVTKQSFFFGRYINIAGMTVRRDFMLEQGGYRDEYYPNEDSILIYQAVLNGRVLNVEHELAGYRQEVNLSLSVETMENIIRKTEMTRRFIAQHEPFAARWMRAFDREYLNAYIEGAKAHWGLELDGKKLLQEFGFKNTNINRVRATVMNALLAVKQNRGK